jgi:hypothetical protein
MRALVDCFTAQEIKVKALYANEIAEPIVSKMAIGIFYIFHYYARLFKS